MTMALEVHHIIKDFPVGDSCIRILHGISFALHSCQLTMIVGPSGCGKTTLLAIMAGILNPTQGKVVINGIDYSQLQDEDKALFRREKIGLIFQQFNLLPMLTVVENVTVPLLAANIPVVDAIACAKDILLKVDMLAHCDKLPNMLSGGQQQRVAIARALVTQPRILICDEPTSALDEKNGQKVMQMLQTLALDLGAAVIIVTHDNRIFHFANRILYLNDGKIEKDEFIRKD